MSKTSLVRATSAAIVLGAGVTLAPLALAAPASAQSICAPGSAAYPPGSCTVNITFNINVTFSGNEIVLVFGNPPGLTVGFGDQFFFFFGSQPVTPVSTGTNGQGQHTATFPAGSVPSGAQTVTVRSNTGAAGHTQLPSSDGASSAQFARVPNGNAVAQDAVSGTGTSSSSGTSIPSGTSYSSSPSSIDTGQPGASSGPNAALIGGGAALVLVAVGGGVFMARRRHES